MQLLLYIVLGFGGLVLLLLVGTSLYRIFEEEIEFKDAFHTIASSVLRTGTARSQPKSDGGTWFLMLFSVLVILYLSIVFVCLPKQHHQLGCHNPCEQLMK